MQTSVDILLLCRTYPQCVCTDLSRIYGIIRLQDGTISCMMHKTAFDMNAGNWQRMTRRKCSAI
jgi:nitrite reductase/ring-hydroxylating ferredoxin subunit